MPVEKRLKNVFTYIHIQGYIIQIVGKIFGKQYGHKDNEFKTAQHVTESR